MSSVSLGVRFGGNLRYVNLDRFRVRVKERGLKVSGFKITG